MCGCYTLANSSENFFCMKNALWILIIIIIAGGGIWWWTNSNSSNSMTAENAAVNENAASPAPVAAEEAMASTSETAAPTAPAMSATITYDGSSYSPMTVTIAKGGTVTFKNASGKKMWVAADEHPTHTEYDNTSRTTHCAAGYTGAKPFDQCKPDTADFMFTFDKVGAIEFHDHLNPSAHGTVTVQ